MVLYTLHRPRYEASYHENDVSEHKVIKQYRNCDAHTFYIAKGADATHGAPIVW